MINLHIPIYLASQSPRRKQLLEWAEVAFEVIVAGTDETFPDTLAINQVPIYIAKQKAQAVLQKLKATEKGGMVIAADTIVVYNDEIIGKPASESHAVEILKKLSGQVHQVITGVVLTDGNREECFYDVTSVEFNTLDEKELVHYVEKYQPFDKAGAYAIQEWIGVVGIAAIHGDFYNVMGLPINKVVRLLKQW
jgi:septum formation protein